ncbi:MAG: helix-turn-helix domain-containing protein [Rhodospirillales bacterium]|nr:helix-turn-helix domain-containing protein [Rhodospirillales bacterium]
MQEPRETRLAQYLRDRRARLDPTALGFAATRRRTPGLRREEVAQRAHISATWYTWLEQGRGGAPSADVLDRLARALLLNEVEREHLFLLGQGRPPATRYRPSAGITPRLQHILDALECSPALVRNASWDVLAWNQAARAVLTDYEALPPSQRNVLRLIFCDPAVRAAQANWEHVARFVLAAFRADATRAGVDTAPIVAELSRRSPEFAAMWEEKAVRDYGEGIKELHHPVAGPIAFEYSAFSIEGNRDLGLVIYHPASPADAALIRRLIAALPAPQRREPT